VVYFTTANSVETIAPTLTLGSVTPTQTTAAIVFTSTEA
jgi:hypothetical protein